MTVDVEGMLCAQALAVVHQSLDPLAPGSRLVVTGGSPDVVRDVLTWAADRRHGAEAGPAGVTLVKAGGAA